MRRYGDHAPNRVDGKHHSARARLVGHIWDAERGNLENLYVTWCPIAGPLQRLGPQTLTGLRHGHDLYVKGRCGTTGQLVHPRTIRLATARRHLAHFGIKHPCDSLLIEQRTYLL